MSRNGQAGPAPAGGWLKGDQRRAWLAYIRVQLLLAYEMNRQLLADSGMSLPDYDVLTALSVADGGRMPITVLAAQIGWERSRVSHHVRRMSARGLVTCGLSAADRRVTEVTLTGRGRRALEEAAPGHVDLVRRLFFGGLPAGPGGAAQRGAGKRVREHHRAGLAPAAGRLAPGGGTDGAACRLGPAPARGRRAWNSRGTRRRGLLRSMRVEAAGWVLRTCCARRDGALRSLVRFAGPPGQE
jgi:DNA-binding MarR family transcriptional regulator